MLLFLMPGHAQAFWGHWEDGAMPILTQADSLLARGDAAV